MYLMKLSVPSVSRDRDVLFLFLRAHPQSPARSVPIRQAKGEEEGWVRGYVKMRARVETRIRIRALVGAMDMADDRPVSYLSTMFFSCCSHNFSDAF